MMMKFLAHGTGSAAKAAKYLTRKTGPSIGFARRTVVRQCLPRKI